ncbi:non-ribosomal peptide synthetase, partial [Myxococcus sp. RHSTA-1-4]|uniref:non-ribosomal peptide synthetase n=1 Tax=Myxococcus sp. RHSTA-1-4 TaxID=2874601 RepID=UPI001CC10CE1
DETFLLIAPVSFDASTLELWGPLLHGARLVVFPPHSPSDLKELEAVLVKHGVTTLHLTAGLFTQVVDSRPEALRHVRQLLTGGDVVSAPHVRRVVEGMSIPVTACYGPTETTLFASCHRMTDAAHVGTSVPIGRPIGNTRVYVLDASGQPVPVGAPGELFIGGDGVARGYVEQPALTAERFVPDACSGVPGARLYRTGDLARWRDDGVLEFLGRADAQVKVRGYRIELAEVEAALLQHPAVREAVVLAREDSPGGKRLVGYVVATPAGTGSSAAPAPRAASASDGAASTGPGAASAAMRSASSAAPTPGTTADSEAAETTALSTTLRAFLAQRLPEYMVPSAIVLLDAFPLTANAKVDRKALPAPEALMAPAGAYVAPRTPTEEQVASLFAQVLGVERVGATDSFFDLGGHSLLATRVASRVRSIAGVDLPLRELFESPTVAGLAARVDALARDSGTTALAPPLVPVPRTGPLPLSFAQQRLWFLDRLEPGSPFYNMPSVLWLDGALDVGALERSLTELVRRHEVLRTTFADGPVQVIHPPPHLSLPVVDLSSLPEASREDEARRLAREEARRPFDLTRGPLLRATLLRLGDTRHLLVLVLHHVVSDGWSMDVLVRESAALYAAFREGRASPLPELPVQYADYAAWQRGWLQGDALESQLSWWREHLAGAPPLLELPTDFPRPATQGFRGASHTRVLPRSLADSLQALSRREGTTLFMALLAGFEAVLSRYSGQEDFVVGTDIANRNRAETEGLIGFFINQLALRARLEGDPTFRELLASVRRTTLGAYAHQDLPFEELVKALNPERDQGHAPLFQVKLVLQNQPGSRLEMPGLTLRTEAVAAGTSRLDLTLSVTETARGLECECEYRTDLFTADTIDRMVRHLGTVLEAAAARPESRLSTLPLLSEDEQRQVLVEWNATGHGFPRESCAHHLFEAQAARTPDAMAVRFEGQALTYAQLDAKANRLAHHLRALGVRQEVPVALCVERSLDLVVAILGILKAGGAWVPMDPGYPVERLTYMLRDCAAPVLVTTEAIADTLPSGGEQLVLLDADAHLLAAWPETRPEARVFAESLAYIIYTSGSTGRPKGTLLQHRGLCNTALTAARAHGFRPDSRVLQYAAFGFDASVAEIFGALLAGATLVLAPRERLMPGAPLRSLLREESITAVTLTPSVLAQLAPDDFPSLETLISAGEACTPELVERWGNRVRLLNAYGPTEVTVCATLSEPMRPGQRLTIGRPWSNVRVYVLDAALRPLPVGVPGELCVDSVGLARGYRHQADLTAERFVPNPFSDVPGARLYRTGDRVRWLEDGTLEYLGRIDLQVKLRGFRIELGEVETALAQHPSVREAVAVVREDAPGDKRLVAYVVAEEGDVLDTAALRAFLKQRLPEHMVPAAISVMEALPLTPNGKVDRKALPSPDAERTEQAPEYVAPRTPMEARLAALWAELLHVPRVGVHDDFFELGGHSLLATQLTTRLRDAFGMELPLRELFEAPTLGAFAPRVEQATRSLARSAPSPVPRTGPLPLSFAQQRLWFLDQLIPGDAQYNLPAALRFQGTLDVPALERAFEELVLRHESLRTTFQGTAEGAVQVIHPPTALPLTRVDLTDLPEERREAEALRLAGDEALRPFDLGHGPLMRVTLLRLGAEDHVLLVTTHHIVSDAWSVGVLIREVGSLYAALATGTRPQLPPLPIQYADYAVWQRGWLKDEALESQLSYWRNQLSGAPHALELPTDRPRPAVQTHRGASLRLRLSRELHEALEALGQREGATPFMVLLAAWQWVLSRHSGQEDICVGSPIAGRTRAETEGLIGFFVNTLVLRTRLSGADTFRALLARVREEALGAYAHQDVPFEKLVEELKPERDLSRTPLFQVMLALQNTPQRDLELPGLTARLFGGSAEVARFDLLLNFDPEPDGLLGTLIYNADLFDAGTAARLLSHLHTLLRSVTARPEQPLASLSLLSEEERRRVLVDWNATSRGYDAACIHQQFESQALRTPDAPALSFGDERLTYRQLLQRVLRLSARLRALGVRPDVPVGLCVQRSPDMVAGMLAILHAGGAYLPLDPGYPAERLAYMLRDSGAAVLVTQRHLAGLLPTDGVQVLPLEEALDGEPASAPGPARAESLAYVIYTSGSTGQPKGVMVPHGTVANFFGAMDALPGLGSPGTWLAVTSNSFDIHVLELLWTLARGFHVVLHDEQAASRTGTALPLPEVLRRHPITHLQCTPSFARTLVLAPESVSALGTLRHLLIGGEALPGPLAKQLREALPAVALTNMYGPTETTVWSSTHAVTEEEPPATVSIGSPIANTRLYVLDAHGQPAVPGAPGELYIAGEGVVRGYLGRPGLTAERFVPDPFSGVPGGRMYRTGDLARWRRDGTLDFLGRADFQVKLRGFRIEPGEVEAALLAFAGVREAAALVREGAPGDARLLGYVSADAGLDMDALRAHLQRRLPDHMVPSALLRLDALPLTANGKLDRRALMALDAPVSRREYVAPRDELEQQVADLWAEVLRVERVGVHDSFFELGGHSLLATQLLTRVHSTFQVRLPVRGLFEQPTVEGMTLLLLEALADSVDASELEQMVDALDSSGNPS